MTPQATRTLATDAVFAPAKLAHIVLKTPRKNDLVRWYETVLGARTVFANDMISFLTYDDEHHRIALLASPEPGAPGTVQACGLHHVAFTYAGLGQLLANFRRLKRQGIEPFWSINHGPTTSMYYQDPDGNHVELQVDNLHTEEEVADFMNSGTFEANPIGVEFDPELLCEEYEAGVPIAQLTRQGAGTPEAGADPAVTSGAGAGNDA